MSLQAASVIPVPAALLALNGLVTVIPFTRRRRHVQRAEQLSKLVSAAGDECPKVLRAGLLREIHWVAAYQMIRTTSGERLLLAAGWVGSGIVFAVTIALGIRYAWYRPGSWAYYAPTILSTLVMAFGLLPAVVIQDSISARRLLVAKFGARGDLPVLTSPRFRTPCPTRSVVKGWVNEVFGEPDPDPSSIDGSHVAELWKVMSVWERARRSRYFKQAVRGGSSSTEPATSTRR